MKLALLLLLAGLALRADYVSSRAEAVVLLKQDKPEEALAAFLELAAGEGSESQKADALEQAALLCNRLDRPAEALELARRIPHGPTAKSVELQLLAERRQWRQIVDQFGGEDLAAWPDMLIGPASYWRGHAHYALKNAEAAKGDLQRACHYLLEDNTLGLAFIALGDTYRHQLGDTDRALQAYRQAYQRRNVYKRCQAAMNAAAILRERGETDAALAELAVIPLEQITLPYWRGNLLAAWGVTLAQAGKTAEASAKFREALALADIPDHVRKTCEEGLRKLGGNAE